MLYGAVKIMMTIACRFFYRRIYATGLESIPQKGPVIIVANHHSSLMDAALLGILVDRPIHFFTRGDLFKNKFAAKLLHSLNMIPVHNHETDRSSLDINNESFLKASGILAAGGIVVFFPEGSSHIDRKLKPFRKGAFRLAFQSAKTNHTSISIVPVGINYSHPSSHGADVMIHVGTPILLNDYLGEYLSNAAMALLHLSKKSFHAIKLQIVSIDNEANSEVAETCLQINRNNYSFHTGQWIQGTRKRLEEEKQVCNKIQQLTGCKLARMKNLTTEYYKVLSELQLPDKTFSPCFNVSAYKGLLVIATLPIFITGYLLNCLPVIVARKLADEKVYRVDFYSWILVSCTMFLYLAWLTALLAGFLVVGWDYALFTVFLAIVTGVFNSYYVQWARDFVHHRKLRMLKQKHPASMASIQELRKSILELL